jgi:transcriptional antiterminator NusG
MAAKWYVIHTYSGHENKVKANLERSIVARELEDKILRVEVPMEEVAEMKNGKRVISTYKCFPGYVLVQMEMNEDTWQVVRNTSGVTGFIGTGSKPIPLSDDEVNDILHHAVSSESKPKPKVLFERGQHVNIVDGPFASFSGVVDEVNMKREKLKVMVSILGRSTPVELDFLQVEKV